MAIADLFDAMTSDRIYKKGVKPEEAIKIFNNVGFSLFDNRIVKVFLNNISDFQCKKIIGEVNDY